jgi:anti-sigma regulatory factor (Ser/Thr protein kinase)
MSRFELPFGGVGKAVRRKLDPEVGDDTTNNRLVGYARAEIRANSMTNVLEPLRLSLDADASSLAPLRRALGDWLREVGAHKVYDVVLAVDEAVANAIEHAGLTHASVITVKAEVVGEILHLKVIDRGAWKQQALDESRGRGLVIMNSVMDSVTIEHRDNETRLVMSRLLHTA